MLKSNKILLYVFVIAFCLPIDVCGQMKEVNISIYKEIDQKPKAEAWKGLKVHGFINIQGAENFAKKARAAQKGNNKFLYTDEDCDALEVTDARGRCTMRLPGTGALVLMPIGGDILVEPVKGRLNMELSIPTVKTIGEVSKTAKRPPQPMPQVPYACGNTLKYKYQRPIEAKDVDKRTRILIAPMITLLETGDTIGYMNPFVKDGVDFLKALKRRTGFNLKRDLYYYDEDSLHTWMKESYKRDSIYIDFELYPIDKNFHYKITADMMFALNMDEPYRSDSICLAEGYVCDKMRFLDYTSVEVPIDSAKLYKRKGTPTEHNGKESLDLNFVVGKAELVETDTLNFIQLDRLKKNLMRYMGLNSNILSVTIHGSASPEGGISFNSRLCRERAEFLKREMSSFRTLRGIPISVTAKVATWLEVANQLEKDSLKEECALVRDAIKGISDAASQERKIRTLPCWKLIEEKILPKFRYVDIQFSYITNRVKSKDEIWKEYQSDPYYREGRGQQDYEFYELFNLIKDPKELEKIAHAAYDAIPDDNPSRRWPLAAYHLAKCYLQRGHIDTTLLKPYMDERVKGIYQDTDFDSSSDVSTANGWYNDPAIVTLHINMLCKTGDFGKAYVCAKLMLPDEPKYNRLRQFLRCLNCEWHLPEVIDTVANSSYWNRIVIYAAQEQKTYRETALYLIDNKDSINQADPKVLYTRAQLLFDLYGKLQKSTIGYQDNNFMYNEFFSPSLNDPYKDRYGGDIEFWGLPMAQCCAIDESYYDIMLWDGEFNEDYRKAFKSYWKKVKSGKLPKPILPEPTAQHKETSVVAETKVEEGTDELMGIDE